jgi:hypothetical protein
MKRAAFQLLPPGLLLAVFVVWMCLTLAGCASLSEVRPWAGIQMRDEATRAADATWLGIGQLWIGFKAHF